MSDHDDLEAYWGDIVAAQRGPIIEASDRPGNLKGSLELAAAKAKWDLHRKHGNDNAALDDAIQTFIDYWRGDLLARGPGGLIELVLEDYKLPIEELRAFVKALPSSLLRRIIDSGAASDKAKGIHALMSVEHLWRTQRQAFRQDYSLSRGEDGIMIVVVHPAGEGASSVTFRLDETFDLTSQV